MPIFSFLRDLAFDLRNYGDFLILETQTTLSLANGSDKFFYIDAGLVSV